jgi:hypothetical protein
MPYWLAFPLTCVLAPCSTHMLYLLPFPLTCCTGSLSRSHAVLAYFPAHTQYRLAGHPPNVPLLRTYKTIT